MPYLIIEFDWPDSPTPEHRKTVLTFRQAAGLADFEEILAASGGIGAGPSSLWIFRIESYATIDRLRAPGNLGKAYRDFGAAMCNVSERIREEVEFRTK